MILMLHQVVGHPQPMTIVKHRETIPPKIRKSSQNGEIPMELGGIQGELCQSKFTEFIINMFLIIYQIPGHPQAMHEVGSGETIPQMRENHSKMVRYQWNGLGCKGDFYQTDYRECIDNMFLMLYQVLKGLNPMAVVGDGEEFLKK